MTTVVEDQPVCVTCNNTQRVCECHIFNPSRIYTALHPPHGVHFWEWRGACPDCRHGVGGRHTFVVKPNCYPAMGECECGAMVDICQDCGLPHTSKEGCAT